MWKSRCLGILPLAIIDPITSVLVYPLIADLFPQYSLALACHASYVSFVFVFKFCITFSSLILLYQCIKQIIRITECRDSVSCFRLNHLYLLVIIWNALFSYVIISVSMRNDELPEMTSEDCLPVRTDDSFVWAGLKALLPQCLVLSLVIVIAMAFLISKQSSVRSLELLNHQHEMLNSQHDLNRRYESVNVQNDLLNLKHNCEISQCDYRNLQGHILKSYQHNNNKTHQLDHDNYQRDCSPDCKTLPDVFQNHQHDIKFHKPNQFILQHEVMNQQHNIANHHHDFIFKHDLDLSRTCLWFVVKNIVLAIVFQSLYFGLHFSFVYCSCGWFRTLSKTMDTLNWTFLIKSIVVVVVSVSARQHHSESRCLQTTSECNAI